MSYFPCFYSSRAPETRYVEFHHWTFRNGHYRVPFFAYFFDNVGDKQRSHQADWRTDYAQSVSPIAMMLDPHHGVCD